jgi:hypothetical protein
MRAFISRAFAIVIQATNIPNQVIVKPEGFNSVIAAIQLPFTGNAGSIYSTNYYANLMIAIIKTLHFEY